MTILYVDDERSAHTIFRHSLGTYEDITEVSYHLSYDSAIAYAKTHEIHCAFLDVSLLDKDGISLAKELRQIQPRIEFVFITAYDEFARAAYEVGGRAYLTKPYSKTELQQALGLMHRLTVPWIGGTSVSWERYPRIFVKTFGSFDLLLDGVPVHFKYSKAKELLAYLIHQMGGSVTNAQVFYALWDKRTYTRDNSTYVRRSIRLLKEELKDLGIENIIVSMRNSTRVDIQVLQCDAYELLKGRKEAVEGFNGLYMSQYHWAEVGLPMLTEAAIRGRENFSEEE